MSLHSFILEVVDVSPDNFACLHVCDSLVDRADVAFLGACISIKHPLPTHVSYLVDRLDASGGGQLQARKKLFFGALVGGCGG
jgi:hypothetical protein